MPLEESETQSADENQKKNKGQSNESDKSILDLTRGTNVETITTSSKTNALLNPPSYSNKLLNVEIISDKNAYPLSGVVYAPLSNDAKVNRMNPIQRSSLERLSPINLYIDLGNHAVVETSNNTQNSSNNVDKSMNNTCVAKSSNGDILKTQNVHISKADNVYRMDTGSAQNGDKLCKTGKKVYNTETEGTLITPRYATDLPGYNLLMEQLRTNRKQEKSIDLNNIHIICVQSLSVPQKTEKMKDTSSGSLTKRDNIPVKTNTTTEHLNQSNVIVKEVGNNLTISSPKCLQNLLAKETTTTLQNNDNEQVMKDIGSVSRSEVVTYTPFSEGVNNNKATDNKPSIMAEVLKPVDEKIEHCKSAQEKYRESHRSKSSTYLLDACLPESVKLIKHDHSVSHNDQLVRRRIEIQRQLEKQRKWIDEHDTRVFSQSALNNNLYIVPGFQTSYAVGYETTIPRPTPQYASSPRVRNENEYMNQLRGIKQQQEYLEQRLSLYQQEINALQRQKQIITAQICASATHTLEHQKRLAMDRQLMSMEENRKQKPFEMLRFNAQMHRPTSHQVLSVQSNEQFHRMHPNFEHYNRNVFSPSNKQLLSIVPTLSNQELVLLKNVEMSSGCAIDLRDTQLILQTKHDEVCADILRIERLMEMERRNLIERTKAFRNYRNAQEMIGMARLRQEKHNQSPPIPTLSTHYAHAQDNKKRGSELHNHLLLDNKFQERYALPIYVDNELKRRVDDATLRISPPKISRLMAPNVNHASHQQQKQQHQSSYELSINQTSFQPTVVSVKNLPQQTISSNSSWHGQQKSSYEVSDNAVIKYPSVAKKHSCSLCNNEAQFLCSGCRVEWYCSQTCQLNGWQTHSKICKKDVR